jgi:pimeloyl-ACP methyl ester carboxylesterase
MTARRVAVNGVGISVDDRGAGEPALVLVHGFANSRQDWSDVIAELAAGRRVIAYDQRGHGESSHTGRPDTYKIDWLVRDLAAVLLDRRLGPVHLLGSSLGGIVALRFALEHPGAVRSLILVNTAAKPTAAIPPKVLERLAETGRTKGMAALGALLDRVGALATHRRTPAQRARFRADVGRMDLAAFVGLGADLGRYDSLLDALDAFDLPVTVMVGEHDRLARKEGEAALARLRLGRRQVLANAAHAPHEENRDAWLAGVHAHLAWFAQIERREVASGAQVADRQ